MSRQNYASRLSLIEALAGALIAVTFPIWIPYWLKLWEWGANLLLGL